MTTTKFCSTDDVKNFLNTYAAGSTVHDALIGAHIKTATAQLREYTRRNWELGTYTDYFNSNDIDVLIRQGRNVAKFYTREKPLVSVTSVKYNTGGDWANTTALDTSLYEIDTRLGAIILYPAKMTSNGRSLQIVYTAGYAVNGVDSDLLDVSENLKSACAMQAAYLTQKAINETQGTNRRSDGGRSPVDQVTVSGLIRPALALVKSEVRLLVGGNA